MKKGSKNSEEVHWRVRSSSARSGTLSMQTKSAGMLYLRLRESGFQGTPR